MGYYIVIRKQPVTMKRRSGETAMPTYEYVCDDGHETDFRHSINDSALEVCPREECQAPARRKISMGAGVITGGETSADPAPAPPSGGACCGPSACGCRN